MTTPYNQTEDEQIKVTVYKDSFVDTNASKAVEDTVIDATSIATKHPWNVITEDEFKKRMSEIFEMVASALKSTLGPYGASTLIESMGTYHLTKDGFTVLKNIHFNNRTDNTILNTILTISHQMVMKVGDGSTLSLIHISEPTRPY